MKTFAIALAATFAATVLLAMLGIIPGYIGVILYLILIAIGGAGSVFIASSASPTAKQLPRA